LRDGERDCVGRCVLRPGLAGQERQQPDEHCVRVAAPCSPNVESRHRSLPRRTREPRARTNLETIWYCFRCPHSSVGLIVELWEVPQSGSTRRLIARDKSRAPHRAGLRWRPGCDGRLRARHELVSRGASRPDRHDPTAMTIWSWGSGLDRPHSNRVGGWVDAMTVGTTQAVIPR
jgi:hypothetical protein